MSRIVNISGSPVTDRGILKLAEYTEANLPEYTLIVGCKPFIYDVDAVLIGNGNIYAIECKDWKGKITGGTYGWWQKDGQVIENPLQQTRNNAAALGKWLRKKIPGEKNIWVKGLLLFTHEEGELHLTLDKASYSGVCITQVDKLKEYISKQRASLTNETINEVVNWTNNLHMNGENMSNANDNIKIAIYIAIGIAFLISLMDQSGITFAVFSVFAVLIFLIQLIRKKFLKDEIVVSHKKNQAELDGDMYYYDASFSRLGGNIYKKK
jgi:hypothetical protein